VSCNTACLLNYDNAPCIPIIAQVDTSIAFSVFYPDPIDLSTGTFVFVLSRDERGDCPVLTIAEGSGLEVAPDTLDGDNGYRISLFIPKDHGLPFYDNYYGEVRNDIDAQTANIILKIKLQINPSIARLS
jgi:hypothetical protein